MKIQPTPLEGAFVLEPEPKIDERGEFARIYCQQELMEIGHDKPIVQVNRSSTLRKGTVRGLHFQRPPKAEIKIVSCIKGSVFDVMVDLRSDSPTFMKWYGSVLSGENRKLMYIPEGFAHGFQSLEDEIELLYMHTEYYSREHEGGLLYSDPVVDITWPLEAKYISDKDKNYDEVGDKFLGIDLA